MTSTDDTREPTARGENDTENSSADVFVEPVRRRSTYTPPPQFTMPAAAQQPVTRETRPPAPVDPVNAPDAPFTGFAPPPASAPPVVERPAAQPDLTPAPDLPDLVTAPFATEPSNPETGSVDLRFSDEPAAPVDSERQVYDLDATFVTAEPVTAEPVIYSIDDAIPLPPVWGSAPAEPAADLPEWAAPPAPEPAPYVPWQPEPFDGRSSWAQPAAPAPEPVDPPSAEAPVREETSPRFMTPDEEAATLAQHAPPVGQPWIPQRRSLDDDHLLDVLGTAGDQPGGTLSAIDALENEMRLRAEEKQEYRDWEDSMLAVGTPEALAAVAKVRPHFTNIVVPPELETSAIPIQYPAGEAPEAPQPAASQPAASQPAASQPASPEPVTPEPVKPEPVTLEPVVPEDVTPEPSAAPADAPAPAEREPTAFAAPAFAPSAFAPPAEATTFPAQTADAPAAEAPAFDAPTFEAPPFEAPPFEPAPEPEPTLPPLVEPPAAVAAPTFATAPIDITPFDDADSGSTITGQHEVAAELVAEAATESAAAVQQPAPSFDGLFSPFVAEVPPFPFEPHEEETPSVVEPAVNTGLFTPGPAVSSPADPAHSPVLNFDDLIAGDPEADADAAHNDAAHPDHADQSSTVDDIAAFFSTETGTTPVVPAPGDPAAGDPAHGASATAATAAAVAAPVAEAPLRERARRAPEPVRQPLFSIEQSGVAPTPVELRVGRASRLFWLWFAANSSVVSIAFGAMLFSLGMSLRQSIVAVLAGIALSFVPLGLGTLAGKRSGQPTVIVSRAAFGLAGNIVPAVLALVSRLFWGGVLLWFFASSIAGVLVSTGADGGLAYESLVFLWLVVGIILAAVVAFFGYALLARVQLVVSVVSAVLIVGFVALTAGRIDVQTALTVVDGSWLLVITGTVLVFSFVGLVWANSSSDLARYQHPNSFGSTSMLWASFGTAVPTFLLIAYGALLAASDPTLAAALGSEPIAALASILPSWYPVPLIAATALSLLSGVIVTVYSGGFALQGAGLRLERRWSTVVIAVLLLVVAAVFSLLSVDLVALFRDLATTLAVPIAAWAGIFVADTMIRTRRYHSTSLLKPGGLYPNVNWVNLGALLLITVVGYGLTTAAIGVLSWQGYLFPIAGVELDSVLAGSDLGVLVALLLGILTPLVSGIPAIRRQETAAL